jgi:hypothetical protein
MRRVRAPSLAVTGQPRSISTLAVVGGRGHALGDPRQAGAGRGQQLRLRF